jgi:hypothetical protein
MAEKATHGLKLSVNACAPEEYRVFVALMAAAV